MLRLLHCSFIHLIWIGIRPDPAIFQINDPGRVLLCQLRVMGDHDNQPVLGHFP